MNLPVEIKEYILSFLNLKKEQDIETMCDWFRCFGTSMTTYYFFQECIKKINKKIDIINYCIYKDDDKFLHFILKNVEGIQEILNIRIILYKKLICDEGSTKCFLYFKYKLNQKFKPEKFYKLNNFPLFL